MKKSQKKIFSLGEITVECRPETQIDVFNYVSESAAGEESQLEKGPLFLTCMLPAVVNF